LLVQFEILNVYTPSTFPGKEEVLVFTFSIDKLLRKYITIELKLIRLILYQNFIGVLKNRHITFAYLTTAQTVAAFAMAATKTEAGENNGKYIRSSRIRQVRKVNSLCI